MLSLRAWFVTPELSLLSAFGSRFWRHIQSNAYPLPQTLLPDSGQLFCIFRGGDFARSTALGGRGNKCLEKCQGFFQHAGRRPSFYTFHLLLW